jgi:hypothetical protein
MLENKKDNLSIFVERTSLVGDVAVSISFKVKLNACCLNKLKGSCACTCFPLGSEEACVCYALYLAVKNALCGDPLATAKSKVGDVYCGAHNGSFCISWKVKGTGSAIRKSLGIALKQLSPNKVFSSYSNCIKEAKGTPRRECFDYVADEITKSINDNVHCGVIGNIKLYKTDIKTKKEVHALDLDEMLNILSKKLKPEPVKGAKHKPNEHSECDHSEKTEVKVNGWQAFVVKDYISAKVKGLNPVICDKYLLLSIKKARWDSFADKIKKSVKDYINQKYSKVGDALPAILGYMMLSSASISCIDVHQMIKNNIKGTDAAKALMAVL